MDPKTKKLLIVFIVFIVVMIPVSMIAFRLFSEQEQKSSEPQTKPDAAAASSSIPTRRKTIYISEWGSSYDKVKRETYIPLQSWCEDGSAKPWCASQTLNNNIYTTTDFNEETGKCKDDTEDCKFNEVDMDGQIVGYFNTKGKDLLEVIVDDVYAMSDSDFEKSLSVAKLLYKLEMSTGMLRKASDNTPVIPSTDLVIPQYALMIALFYKAAKENKPIIRVHVDNVPVPTVAQTVKSYKDFVALMTTTGVSRAPRETSPSDSSNVALTTETIQIPPTTTTEPSSQVPSPSNSVPTSTGPVAGNANALNGVQGMSV